MKDRSDLPPEDLTESPLPTSSTLGVSSAPNPSLSASVTAVSSAAPLDLLSSLRKHISDISTATVTAWHTVMNYRYSRHVLLAIPSFVGSYSYLKPALDEARANSSELGLQSDLYLTLPVGWSTQITNILFFAEGLDRLRSGSEGRSLLFDFSTRESLRTSLAAFFIAIFNAVPLFFLGIKDSESGEYLGEWDIGLAVMASVVNLLINAIATKDILDDIFCPPEATETLTKLSKAKKMIRCLLLMVLTPLSFIPNAGFTLVSYFGMKDLAEKMHIPAGIGSISLGGVAATANMMMGAVFMYKGLQLLTQNILKARKGPSLPQWILMFNASLSGFASSQLMRQSLDKLGVENIPLRIALSILANVGTLSTCNIPIALNWYKNAFGSKPESRLQSNDAEHGSGEEALRLVTIQDGQPKSSVQLSTMGHGDSEAVLHVATVHRQSERSVQPPEVGQGESKKTLSLVTVSNGQPGNNITPLVGTVTKVGIFKVNSQPLLIDQPVEHDSQRMVRFNSI